MNYKIGDPLPEPESLKILVGYDYSDPTVGMYGMTTYEIDTGLDGTYEEYGDKAHWDEIKELVADLYEKMNGERPGVQLVDECEYCGWLDCDCVTRLLQEEERAQREADAYWDSLSRNEQQAAIYNLP